MDTEKIKTLGDAWKVLDEKYDNFILEIINSEHPALSKERSDELKKMQDELFDLETELFGILNGE